MVPKLESLDRISHSTSQKLTGPSSSAEDARRIVLNRQLTNKIQNKKRKRTTMKEEEAKEKRGNKRNKKRDEWFFHPPPAPLPGPVLALEALG